MSTLSDARDLLAAEQEMRLEDCDGPRAGAAFNIGTTSWFRAKGEWLHAGAGGRRMRRPSQTSVGNSIDCWPSLLARAITLEFTEALEYGMTQDLDVFGR